MFTAIDQHGNLWTGTTDAIAVYDDAVDRLLRFHPAVLEHTATLTAEHPEAAVGHLLTAYLSLMSTDASDVPAAHDALTALEGMPSATPIERAHRDAIDRWVAGDWIGAAHTLDDLLVRWPTDLLALAIGHQLDFFLADAMALRDRPARTLAQLDPEHPHSGLVQGMRAFGLEEAGHYELAEAAGLSAIDANRDDVWGIHAVAHTYEMQGRVDDGIRFMESRRDDWGDGNLFTVHNWWHLALYYLEAGLHGDVLGIYDGRIHHTGSAGVPLEMVDASSLLWRLLVDGVDTGDRFEPLASAWATSLDGRDPWYSFNDVHAVLAFAGSGRLAEARGVVARLERDVAAGGSERTNVMMTDTVALPVCRGLLAFAEGRYDSAFAALHPIRRTFAAFGGSHAQRDALQRTLVEAALRAGLHDRARALLDERLALRGTSTFAWARRARIADDHGEPDVAARARRRCTAQQTRFAAARTR